MAFAALSNAQTAWFLAFRPGGKPGGTPGTALVSDLAAGDYDAGSRATVVTPGTTTSGVRTLTMSRPGVPNFTVQWTATTPLLIIR